MTNNHLPRNGGAAAPQDLSPEEKAILDGEGTFKKTFRMIWQIKVSLQFTGWLQYIPPAIGGLVLLLTGAFVRFLGYPRAAGPFIFIGGLLLIWLIFDLATVKFRLRFPERLPERNDHLEIFDLMRTRRSCRSFQTRTLTPADHTELMEYVRLHSEAAALGKAKVRFEYIAAPLTVWPTVNATEFLVAIVPRAYDRLAVIDVGRSLQKIVMDATRMGLGTCWIGPGADHSSIMQHLGERYNPEQDHIICVCAFGYKSGYVPLFLRIFNWQFRRRLPLSALFFADSSFVEPLDVEAAPFNRFGRTYEICQWAPSSYNGQTTRCVAVMKQNVAGKGKGDAGEPGIERFDFYAATESRYYAAVALGIWYANWELGCAALGIHGHPALLSAEDRGAHSPQPRYDMSWVLDDLNKVPGGVPSGDG